MVIEVNQSGLALRQSRSLLKVSRYMGRKTRCKRRTMNEQVDSNIYLLICLHVCIYTVTFTHSFSKLKITFKISTVYIRTFIYTRDIYEKLILKSQ